MDSKKPWQSKTVIAGAITGLLPLIPGVGEAVQSHPQEAMGLIGFIFTLLRIFTAGKVELK